jgi:hypothetical protein
MSLTLWTIIVVVACVLLGFVLGGAWYLVRVLRYRTVSGTPTDLRRECDILRIERDALRAEVVRLLAAIDAADEREDRDGR